MWTETLKNSTVTSTCSEILVMAGHRIVYLTYFEVSDTNKNLLRKNCASSRCRWVAGTIVQIVESGLQRSIVVLAVDTPSFKEDFLQVLLDEVFFLTITSVSFTNTCHVRAQVESS